MSKTDDCNLKDETHTYRTNQIYRRHIERGRTKNTSKATGIPLIHEKGKGNLKTDQVTENFQSIFRKSGQSP